MDQSVGKKPTASSTAEFGDTGFPGFTSNPGFDAEPGSLPAGRIGFEVLAGLRRWDPLLEDWLEPSDVGERLEISYITLSTLVEDEPIMGFDLAVQPDGGWHRHVNSNCWMTGWALALQASTGLIFLCTARWVLPTAYVHHCLQL